MIKRRNFLPLMALTAISTALHPAANASAASDRRQPLRGTLPPEHEDTLTKSSVAPGADLAKALAKAVREGRTLMLEAGDYAVSDLDLPDGAHLTGIPGATRLIYKGGGSFLRTQGSGRVSLQGLIIDGAGRPLAPDSPALLHARAVDRLTIANCQFQDASASAIQLEGCSARLTNNSILRAADYALYALDGAATEITGNQVDDCGNGGILVHRRAKGYDGTIVTGNRLTNIRAVQGGTGPFGNAINTYRADNVMISNNHIRGAAFSAIRANASSGVQIIGNQCLASGETAIYSEFGFEGAIVNGNLIDGAANGISVVNFDTGGRLAVISGNIIRNISDRGPYVHDVAGFGFGLAVEADASVTGNVIENAARAGLLLGWGPYLRDVVVSGNVVRKVPTGCMVTVVEGAGRATITNNLFEATAKGAIIGYRWLDAASGELARGSQQFPHLTIANNSLG
ncbi:TIGR03808 family TAT-translocated repetitive protein [Rhizobium oryzicola]|uniref:TIGR03808 family TAT-translocated repetitive protein n=1 Tax=Rhizobium oryzicola TaxID=1232668 RepID=A0ABT8SUH7_9HYPH|nr:TIGR03808 family TAT-translocated repetitive protein [Rhizobium oryzicola]MDO1581407.1 TIGR03808 family TAT-translocated repetitive protein [Rhizobium oryzicola]